MSLDDIRPTTIPGVKRLAKQIKKRDGVRYMKALEAAARQAGFSTYHEASTRLAEAGNFVEGAGVGGAAHE